MEKTKIQEDLDLIEINPNFYETPGPIHAFRVNISNSNSFGGALVYQAIYAAYKTVPATFNLSTTHLYFLNGVKSKEKAEYRVTRLRDGKATIHREVKIIQGPKVAMVLLAMFTLKAQKNRFGRQPLVNASITANSQNKTRLKQAIKNIVNEAPITKKEGFPPSSPLSVPQHFPRMIHGLGYKLDQLYLNTLEDPNGLKILEVYFPKAIVKGDRVVFRNETVKEFDADVVLERELFSIVRGCPGGSGTVDTPENSSIGYRCFLGYISDYTTLSCCGPLLGWAYADERFVVSLDHALYYQEPQNPTGILDWHIVRHNILKGKDGQYTVKLTIYNSFGESVAIAIQEGISVLDNRKGQLSAKKLGSKL
ncbi:hypothetical protein DASC09_057510 [Saccharomycopsis crataegensis]|uniref:Acyl-CoA thioesterase-like N-terminal HotDog domain-containing protein n=1 Tax=Saccharomycopsis crataegensis TaxID=43959 RepID=A0AAV5QU18_9ASCO|nr:hypothetical protein DASC09_057510 [Saccharomycopsis crataegensis]